VIKTIFAWRDNPDLGAEACEAHYRAHHMPMAREAFQDAPGFIAIVFNRVRRHTVHDRNERDRREVPTDFDGYVELFFEDQEQMAAAFAAPKMQELFEDHGNFMDVTSVANIRVYEVDETVILSRGSGRP
jgi:uncharacterized protein (TIGR02118 family)